MVSLENALNVDIHYFKKFALNVDRTKKKEKKRFCILFVSPCTALFSLVWFA